VLLRSDISVEKPKSDLLNQGSLTEGKAQYS
jgi:hypothetical protein